MSGIIEGFKRIYSDDNSLVKHLILFVLTGVISMFALPINELSKKTVMTNGEWWFAMLSLIFCLAVGLYVAGFIYRFINMLYNDESGLPDFNIRNLVKGLKFFPVILVWCLYFFLFFVGCVIVGIKFKVVSTVLFVLLLLLILFWLIMLPMFTVEYSKEYRIKSLFSFIKPFTYVKDALGRIAIVIVKLLPFIIVLLILNAISTNDKSVFGYLTASVQGYLSFVFIMLINYCYFKITKEVYCDGN